MSVALKTRSGITNSSSRKPLVWANCAAYMRWRDSKLDHYKTDSVACLVEISNPHQLSIAEKDKISKIIAANNFVIYQFRQDIEKNHDGYRSICRQIGLRNAISNPGADQHCVTRIEVAKSDQPEDQIKQRYIPYSNQKLNWHTDGYYNEGSKLVRSFVLHCERSADHGGHNLLLDHEIAYILLHQKNPDLIDALCHPECFTIPENVQNNQTIRQAFTGAVFSADPLTGNLYTRYTQRKHNLRWRPDSDTSRAISAMETILEEEHSWILKTKLQPGQGLICNNILHRREAFHLQGQGQQNRLMYRIRFSDRIFTPTGKNHV